MLNTETGGKNGTDVLRAKRDLNKCLHHIAIIYKIHSVFAERLSPLHLPPSVLKSALACYLYSSSISRQVRREAGLTVRRSIKKHRAFISPQSGGAHSSEPTAEAPIDCTTPPPREPFGNKSAPFSRRPATRKRLHTERLRRGPVRPCPAVDSASRVSARGCRAVARLRLSGHHSSPVLLTVSVVFFF